MCSDPWLVCCWVSLAEMGGQPHWGEEAYSPSFELLAGLSL